MKLKAIYKNGQVQNWIFSKMFRRGEALEMMATLGPIQKVVVE